MWLLLWGIFLDWIIWSKQTHRNPDLWRCENLSESWPHFLVAALQGMFSFSFLFSQDRLSPCIFDGTETLSVDQAGLELSDPFVSASWTLWLKVCVTTPGLWIFLGWIIGSGQIQLKPNLLRCENAPQILVTPSGVSLEKGCVKRIEGEDDVILLQLTTY